MAFQDTCGGIVLDAVLTDIGRKRMAQGKFRVVKFAIGDDEINYEIATYTPGTQDTNPLIKAQPVFEAFAMDNAVINHGLVNYIRKDIYYVPQLSVNTKPPEAAEPVAADASSGRPERYYLSVNSETTAKLKAENLVGEDKYILESGELVKTKILVESGLQTPTSVPPATKLGKQRFITNLGLLDDYFIIYCDSRLVESMLTSPRDSYFRNDVSNNLYMSFEPLKQNVKISLGQFMKHYDSYRVEAANQEIYYVSTGDSTIHTPNAGPRGTIMAFNFKVHHELTGDSTSTTDDLYYIFGHRSQAVFGSSNTYDYIDTTIYIEGLSTNSRLQVPVRIIRYTGTT